jgi:hypothetical protein
MSENSMLDGQEEEAAESTSRGGRHKQKIRIKYRQKVKIKRRPRGYKLKKYWRKNKKNFLSYAILVLLLGATLFMVVQVAKQQLEHKRHEKNQKLKLR